MAREDSVNTTQTKRCSIPFTLRTSTISHKRNALVLRKKEKDPNFNLKSVSQVRDYKEKQACCSVVRPGVGSSYPDSL